jgi:hypothetical protein
MSVDNFLSKQIIYIIIMSSKIVSLSEKIKSEGFVRLVTINIGNTKFVDGIEVKTIGECYNCHNNINHSVSKSCNGTCYMCWKCLEFQHIIGKDELKKGHNIICKSIIPKCYNNKCKGERLVQQCYLYNKCKNYTKNCSECIEKVFGMNGYCDGCLTKI